MNVIYPFKVNFIKLKLLLTQSEKSGALDYELMRVDSTYNNGGTIQSSLEAVTKAVQISSQSS